MQQVILIQSLASLHSRSWSDQLGTGSFFLKKMAVASQRKQYWTGRPKDQTGQKAALYIHCPKQCKVQSRLCGRFPMKKRIPKAHLLVQDVY